MKRINERSGIKEVNMKGINHIIIKLLKTSNKEKKLKTNQRKKTSYLMRNSENKDFSQWGWGSLAGRKLEDSGTTSSLKGKQKPVNLEFYCKNIFQKMSKMKVRASLVVQWLRIFLSMQGTQVWCLVLKDPTCHEALKLLHHNYWSPCTQDPMLHNKRSHCSEKPMHCN